MPLKLLCFGTFFLNPKATYCLLHFNCLIVVVNGIYIHFKHLEKQNCQANPVFYYLSKTNSCYQVDHQQRCQLKLSPPPTSKKKISSSRCFFLLKTKKNCGTMDFLFYTQEEVKDVAPLSLRQPVQCSDQAISCACCQEKRPVCLGGDESAAHGPQILFTPDTWARI